jgi:hypothetical protein
MVRERNIHAHGDVFDIDYGEEAVVAGSSFAPIPRSRGLSPADRDGEIEAAADLPGFGPNPLAEDRLCARTPQQAAEDVRRLIAKQRTADD